MAKDLNVNPDKIAENRAETKGQMKGSSQAPSSGSGKTVVSSTTVKWKVPTLAYDFDLSSAEEMAYKRAGKYMNSILERDDMQISLEQDSNGWIGQVSDLNTGVEVSRYEGKDVLKLYAQNFKERGIIVDGRV